MTGFETLAVFLMAAIVVLWICIDLSSRKLRRLQAEIDAREDQALNDGRHTLAE